MSVEDLPCWACPRLSPGITPSTHYNPSRMAFLLRTLDILEMLLAYVTLLKPAEGVERYVVVFEKKCMIMSQSDFGME